MVMSFLIHRIRIGTALPAHFLRFATLNVQNFPGTVLSTLRLLSDAEVDVAALQEVNINEGSSAYIRNRCKDYGYELWLGEPYRGRILVATIAKVALHPLCLEQPAVSAPNHVQMFSCPMYAKPSLVVSNTYGHASNEFARDRLIGEVVSNARFHHRHFICLGDWNCVSSEGRIAHNLANGIWHSADDAFGIAHVSSSIHSARRIDGAYCNFNLALREHMQAIGPRDHHLLCYVVEAAQEPLRHVRRLARKLVDHKVDIDVYADLWKSASVAFSCALVRNDEDMAWAVLSDVAEDTMGEGSTDAPRRSAAWNPIIPPRQSCKRVQSDSIKIRRFDKLLRSAKMLVLRPDDKALLPES